MFRHVDLPAHISGKLLLHSMPGRYEIIESAWNQVKNDNVSTIVCLAEKDEIREKSFEYALAIETDTVPCPLLTFEIPDRGAPADRERFWALSRDLAQCLSAGQTVLIHCVGGVGRTAMLAVCVLIALGEAVGQARKLVSRAGSTVETALQSELIAWCAEQGVSEQQAPAFTEKNGR
jgi:protein-tyrosine phosphatase